MMLDEPSLGLSPLLSSEVFAQIGELSRERNITILAGRAEYPARTGTRELGLCHRAWKGRHRRAAGKAARRQQTCRCLSRPGRREDDGRAIRSLKDMFENSNRSLIMKQKWITASIAATLLAASYRDCRLAGNLARLSAIERRPVRDLLQDQPDRRRNGSGGDQRRGWRWRQEAQAHFVRHRRQAGSGGGRPAQARRG